MNRVDELLDELTRTILRPALEAAGVAEPERYRVDLDYPPRRLRGCEHRTLVADFPSGFAPIEPSCGCAP